MSEIVDPIAYWRSHKRADENLYRVAIPDSEIYFVPPERDWRKFRDYLTFAIFLEDYSAFRQHNAPSWEDNFERYCRLVGLYDQSYGIGQTIPGPVSAYWHPGMSKVIPPCTPMALHLLFGNGSQEYVYFNTLGVQNDFLKGAAPITEEELSALARSPSVNFRLEEKNGSVIPKLATHQSVIEDTIASVHARLRDRYIDQGVKVWTNRPEEFPDWLFAEDGQIAFEWKSEPQTGDDVRRAYILLGAENPNYEDDVIRVSTR